MNFLHMSGAQRNGVPCRAGSSTALRTNAVSRFLPYYRSYLQAGLSLFLQSRLEPDRRSLWQVPGAAGSGRAAVTLVQVSAGFADHPLSPAPANSR